MAEQKLNIQLNYKGKYLDTIRDKRDFNNSFSIGKNKNLFWQIDDDSFPDKYKFLVKSGSQFKFILSKGMNVKVVKNGIELSEEDLKKGKFLKNGNLIVEDNTEGTIDFSNEWNVNYYFKEPYKYEPTREQVAIHRKYAKPPKLSEEVKFTRIFVLLGLLFTIIGIYIGEMNYEPPKAISFTERYQRVQEVATKVEIDVPEVVVKEEPTGTYKKTETEEEAQQVIEEAAETTSAEFASEFGLELGGIQDGEGDESFAGEILEFTEVGEIVVSGGAQNSGGGSNVKQADAALDLAGSGGFDLSSAEGGLGDFSGLSGLDLGGSGEFEEVDIGSLGGEAGSFTTTKVTSKAQFQQIKKKYAGIKMVKESTIELVEQSSEAKTETANIKQIVNTYKPQIIKLYNNETMIMNMYGTIEFGIIIAANGKVEAVTIEESDGSFFTDSFLAKAKVIIMKWTIQVKEPVGYSFRMKFYKN